MGGFENTNTEPCSTFYGAGCALYQDLFRDLTTLGGPPTPPPPPIRPLVDSNALTPVRIFFSQGMSPNMLSPSDSGMTGRYTDYATTPYRRRNLQSEDGDESVEIIDSTDDAEVIRTCTEHTDHDTLCETAGYENAVRSFAFKPILKYTYLRLLSRIHDSG